ncbi:MAG TPA: hypothetical protein VH518_04060, partial [Tepidisphaeraceae bacterium]
IAAGGDVTLERCTIQNNSVQGTAGYLNGDAVGGAIFSGRSLVITDCIIRNNSAVGAPGVNGTSKPKRAGTDGGNAYGGALAINGILGDTTTIRNSIITGNVAVGGIGGRNGGRNGKGFGGGIWIRAASVFNGYFIPAASAALDAFTAKHTVSNTATGKNPDIFGDYVLIA